LIARQEGDSCLWHKRLGHLNYNSLTLLSQKKIIWCTGYQQLRRKMEYVNDVYLENTTANHFQRKEQGEPRKCWNWCTQKCGPMSTLSHAQNMYFILFIDDLTRMTWVYFIRQNSEVFVMLKKFKAFVEKQSGKLIKVLRSDKGKEVSFERQLTVGYTPQQNGVSERNNQTVMEKGIPKELWPEAINTTVYLLNRCPTKAV